MELSERIKKLRELKGLNKTQLAELIGVSDAAVGQYEKGKSTPSAKILLRLNDVLGYDFIQNKELTQTNTSTIPIVNEDHRGAPYYDVDFIAGFDLVLNDQTIKPAYYIDFLPFNDVDCWLNVTGKSMGPLIAHGDIVALKKLNDWRDFLLFGEIYAIVTAEFRTIKILGKGKDEDHFRLIPYNKSPEYDEQQVPKNIITHIFRVKGALKKFF